MRQWKCDVLFSQKTMKMMLYGEKKTNIINGNPYKKWLFSGLWSISRGMLEPLKCNGWMTNKTETLGITKESFYLDPRLQFLKPLSLRKLFKCSVTLNYMKISFSLKWHRHVFKMHYPILHKAHFITTYDIFSYLVQENIMFSIIIVWLDMQRILG